MKQLIEPFSESKRQKLTAKLSWDGEFPEDITELQAFEFSLAKWHPRRKESDRGNSPCGLCERFKYCNKCPLFMPELVNESLGDDGGCCTPGHPFDAWCNEGDTEKESAAADVMYAMIHKEWKKL